MPRIAQVSTLAVREIDSPLCNVSANQYIGLCRCEPQFKLDACWMPAGCLDATENQKKSGNKINKNQGPNESHLLLESKLLRVQLFQHIGTFSLRSARS